MFSFLQLARRQNLFYPLPHIERVPPCLFPAPMDAPGLDPSPPQKSPQPLWIHPHRLGHLRRRWLPPCLQQLTPEAEGPGLQVPRLRRRLLHGFQGLADPCQLQDNILKSKGSIDPIGCNRSLLALSIASLPISGMVKLSIPDSR